MGKNVETRICKAVSLGADGLGFLESIILATYTTGKGGECVGTSDNIIFKQRIFILSHKLQNKVNDVRSMLQCKAHDFCIVILVDVEGEVSERIVGETGDAQHLFKNLDLFSRSACIRDFFPCLRDNPFTK